MSPMITIVRDLDILIKESGAEKIDLDHSTAEYDESFENIKFDLIADSMREVKYNGCRFENCEFSGLDMRYSEFDDADLRGANFTGADLKGADFTDAQLDGAQFDGAIMDGWTIIEGWNIMDGWTKLPAEYQD